MEAWRSSPTPGPKNYAIPIIALSAVCCLVGVWSVFVSGLAGAEWQLAPLLLAGMLLGFISLFEIRVGLAVLLLAVGLSPELSLYGVDNFRFEDFIFPILMFVWLTRHTMAKRKFASTDLKTPILIILFLALVSSLNNHLYGGLDLSNATFRFGKSVEYYIIFFIVLNSIRGTRDLKAFAWLLILTSSFVGVYGLIQYGVYGAELGSFRITGPPGETANILGGYYVFHMCLAAGLVTQVTGTPRLLLFLYLGLMLTPFMGTLSRTSYVALFIGLAVIGFASRSRALGWVLCLVTIAAFLAPSTTAERFWSIFGIFTGDSPSSWVARVEGWSMLLDTAIDAPLLGHGVGRTPLGAVDNEYVLQINEIGVFGLMAFLWLISKCIRTSFKLMQKPRTEESGNPDPVLHGFAYGYFGGLVALLVHSLGATTFTTIRTTEPFFFATGLIYCYWNLVKGSRDRSASHSAEQTPLIGRVPLGQSLGTQAMKPIRKHLKHLKP